MVVWWFHLALWWLFCSGLCSHWSPSCGLTADALDTFCKSMAHYHWNSVSLRWLDLATVAHKCLLVWLAFKSRWSPVEFPTPCIGVEASIRISLEMVVSWLCGARAKPADLYWHLLTLKSDLPCSQILPSDMLLLMCYGCLTCHASMEWGWHAMLSSWMSCGQTVHIILIINVTLIPVIWNYCCDSE